ncbi:MAG: SIS domain-containing protein [Candidatus Competibacterales bacterium]
MANHIDVARRVLAIEAMAITDLAKRLTNDFDRAVAALLEARGRVVVSGMGKSGIVAQKISATLASTGTPSFFMHPAEAYHGDLGMVAPEDIFLALSHSGETEEVVRLVPFLRDNGNALVAMTGNDRSTLAQAARVHLDVAVAKEACPLQLAPTASTTAALAMGDALAVALMEAREFRSEHFARFHPGGRLGRLFTRVEQVMRKEGLPVVHPESPMAEVVHTVSRGRLGVAIVAEGQRVVGIITDGDLRRAVESHLAGFAELIATQIMTKDPVTITSCTRLIDAQELMHRRNITALVVSHHGELQGVVHLHDCAV